MNKYPNELPDYEWKYLIMADKELTIEERTKARDKYLAMNPSFEPKKNQIYEIDYESLWE